MIVVLRWWFIFCMSAFGIFVAWNMNFFHYMLKVDISYLSAVTVVVFILSTIWVGQLTFKSRNGDQDFTRHLPICWYIAEAMMGLGMLGTLTGFLVLLGSALGSPINTADTAAMQALIAQMANGFSTSAITTIVGLACSLVFKLQLINLEYLKESN